MSDKAEISWTVIIIWAFLALIGLTAIYSATQGPVSAFLPDYIQQNFGRQALWISISLVILVAVQFTSPRTFQGVAYPFYGLCIFLMVLTLFFGVEVSGSKSWLRIGPFNMQVGELMKLGTILAVANYISGQRDLSSENIKTALTTLGFFLVPVILLILQNETGTAIIFLGLLPVILFLSGLSYGISLLMISPALIAYFTVIDWTLGIITAVLLTIIIFFLQKRTWLGFTSLILGALVIIGTEIALNEILQPHQRSRVEAFVNPSVDPQGAGWNVIQATTAIGSGGVYGKGFLQGTQTQLRFLPEQWTDFIYCVISEEFGFIGSTTVLFLFLFLILKLLQMAVTHKHPFAQLVLAGVAFTFFLHLVINIGSATSLIPVIGLPLPFVSYGGSAFLTNTLMLAICINMDFYKRSFSIYR